MRYYFIFIVVFNSFITAQYTNVNILSDNLMLSFNGEATVGMTDYKAPIIGIGGNAGVEYFFPTGSRSSFGLKLEASAYTISGKDQTRQLPIFRTDIYQIGGKAVYSYSASKSIYPFIAIGISNAWFYPNDNYGNPAPRRNKKLYDLTVLSYDAIIGIKVPLSSIFIINSGIGFHIPNTDRLDDTTDGIGNDYFFTLNLGLSMSLTGKKDNDKDGIEDGIDDCGDQPEDKDGFRDDDGCPDFDNDEDGIPDLTDKCALLIEDFDGYEDYDGCPELDNDQDGVLDANDKCLNTLEDFDGFEDNDGCPEPDNDKDAINDNIDKCSNLAEDYDGFEDFDGCPDVDNDSDGILDVDDRCPEYPETYNNYNDNDGCPDVIPPSESQQEEIPKKDKSSSQQNKNVVPQYNDTPRSFLLHGDRTFDLKSSNLKKEALTDLDRIIATIKKYPGTKWRIEGYMDNSGKSDETKKLSQRRAESVYNYFISKGIKASDLKFVGMGDRNPIENNDKEFGRMRNRRVEIKRIQ